MPVHSSFRFARCQDGTTSLNTQHLTYQAYHPANAASNALKRTELYAHQVAVMPIEWMAQWTELVEKSKLFDLSVDLALDSGHKRRMGRYPQKATHPHIRLASNCIRPAQAPSPAQP